MVARKSDSSFDKQDMCKSCLAVCTMELTNAWCVHGQPNGVVLSPGGKVAYVTDTGCKHADAPDGGQCTSPNISRSIYAFDIIKGRCSPAPMGSHW